MLLRSCALDLRPRRSRRAVPCRPRRPCAGRAAPSPDVSTTSAARRARPCRPRALQLRAAPVVPSRTVPAAPAKPCFELFRTSRAATLRDHVDDELSRVAPSATFPPRNLSPGRADPGRVSFRSRVPPRRPGPLYAGTSGRADHDSTHYRNLLVVLTAAAPTTGGPEHVTNPLPDSNTSEIVRTPARRAPRDFVIHRASSPAGW